MAYDGIITYGIVNELARLLVPGKIEKVYEPSSGELILQIYSGTGRHRLLISCASEAARVCLTGERYRNPEEAPNFCMLLRKHIQSGHITEIRQKGSDRIIEIDIETISELGLKVSKRLIAEIMGKHSNIIILDIESGKIIDSIKHVSIDVNRYRQILPGALYKYPPEQDRLPFKDIASDEDILKGEQVGQIERAKLLGDPKYLMNKIAGISPAIARELASYESPARRLAKILSIAESCGRSFSSDFPEGNESSKDTQDDVPKEKYCVYLDDSGDPIEFHLAKLCEYEPGQEDEGSRHSDRKPECLEYKKTKDARIKYFDTLSECVEYYYQHREQSNSLKLKAQPLLRSVRAQLEKSQLKKKKIGEDILKAEDSDKYRLYGELITANIHLIRPGDRLVELTNYYTGEPIDVPLDEKISASKNAQHYFKQYAKAKTALKEKATQLEETDEDIVYLESVLQALESVNTEDGLDSIRAELIDSGYLKIRRGRGAGSKNRTSSQRGAKQKPEPISYTLSDGSLVYVGRNNIENDYLSTKFAERMDLWFHTKDIPGSHVILKMDRRKAEELDADILYEAAAIAAFHSKGKDSENVPVDFTYIKYVKKPSGAKPGMVIFTNNTTVYVDPKIPQNA